MSIPSTLNTLLLQAISVCGCSPLDKPVAELLISYRSSKCADERDAIFALLALGGNDPMEPHYKRERLGMSPFKPSYNLSTVEIYTRFALHCIHGGYYAQILCMAICFPCEGALSWVPDMRLAGEAKGFRGTEFMLCSNLLTSSWPKIRKSREGMRAGNAFSSLHSRTIPTADRTGFWLAPDIPHTAHEIQWVGSSLPGLHSRDLVVATLRQWLSPFVMESVCEHSEPFGFAEGRILQERYLCQCDEAKHCRALVQDPDASSRTSSEESAGILYKLARSVLVREVVGPTNGMQLPSSRSFKWRSLAETKVINQRAQDEIYINASMLALDKPGLISLEILSLYLGTIVSLSRADAAPTLSAKGCAEWFGIAASERFGLLQLLTSDFGGTSASIFQAWKPLFVDRREQTRDRPKKGSNSVLHEADCIGQICASLQKLGSARMCVLSEQKACWKRTSSSEHRGNRDGFREGTVLVLCPQETQEGDSFVVLKVSHEDRDRPARRFGSQRSASSVPCVELEDTSEDSDEEDSHVHFVPRRYDYLSLVLTPSGRKPALPTSLRNNISLCKELKDMEGHRILGDGFVPYLYWGLYSSQAQILINA